MHPRLTYTFTSHIALALALAAGLTLPRSRTPRLSTAATMANTKGMGRRRSLRRRRPPARSAVPGTGRHGAATSGAVPEYQVAHHKMMRNMAVPYTGDPDVDFRVQMIPHHQGAIDMARVALRHAKDPWTRQMAEGVIVEQQREIAEMQQWLARRGVTPPPGGQPRHLITANSYRTIPDEPGTRAELRGQSWAPGLGVPASR